MRVAIAIAIAAAFALALAACAEERSPRCEEVCQREADCAETLADDEIVVNKSECVKVCTELDRDPEGAKLTAAHVQCVAAARDCRSVFDCR